MRVYGVDDPCLASLGGGGGGRALVFSSEINDVRPVFYSEIEIDGDDEPFVVADVVAKVRNSKWGHLVCHC